MDHDFRAGLLSSVIAAGLIIALTLLAIGEPAPGRGELEQTEVSRAYDGGGPKSS